MAIIPVVAARVSTRGGTCRAGGAAVVDARGVGWLHSY